MTREIPVWKKYTLSIEEAADYFRIGQKRLRQMVAENPDAEYIVMNGNRVQIKRKLFEQYIDRRYSDLMKQKWFICHGKISSGMVK